MSDSAASRFGYLDALLAAQPFLPPMTTAEREALVERIAKQTTPEVQRA